MKWGGSIGLCFGMMVLSSVAQERELALFDIGSAPVELTADALAKRAGWVKAPEGAKAALQGGAALVNPQMIAVLRPKAAGVDVYGVGADGVKLRARLAPFADGAELTLASVRPLSVEPDAVSVEASFKGARGVTVTVEYSLGLGNPILKTKPGAGVAGQRLDAPSRLGVLPDFFADDMLIDARAIPVERAEIPSENFFMNMLDGGNAIVTAVWDKSQRDVVLTLKGEGADRVIAGVDVFYGQGGSFWLAVIEEPNIWAMTEISTNNVKNVVTLPWKSPWKAKWKGNFVRADHTVDSWEFEYNVEARARWSGVVGNYPLPCWFGPKDATQAFIQAPTQFPNGNFDGPFVVYPVERTAETPLERLTITDVMRNSLGIGPCEYIMDVAGQGSANKGIYTCSVEHTVPLLFDLGLQKEERGYIDMMCREVQVFVKAIEDRINGYVAFREETLKYLAEQKMAHPDQLAFIVRLEEQTKRIQAEKAKNAEPVARLVERLRPAVLADVPSASAHELCANIAGVGLGGDNAVARCRQTVKVLRQMATIEMAINPKAADVAKEMRKRTQQILRSALGHEMR